jgi:hypothetical protein
MQHHTHTALFTTVSGVVGGVGKAISAKPLLLAITLPGLTTVIIYASASAVAGYVVKETSLSARKLIISPIHIFPQINHQFIPF